MMCNNCSEHFGIGFLLGIVAFCAFYYGFLDGVMVNEQQLVKYGHAHYDQRSGEFILHGRDDQ